MRVGVLISPDRDRNPARVGCNDERAAEIARQAGRGRDEGATHLPVNTIGAGFKDVEEHLDALTQAAQRPGTETPSPTACDPATAVWGDFIALGRVFPAIGALHQNPPKPANFDASG